MKRQYYKHIKETPLWNYIEVQKTGDVRYLYKLNDYSKLPKLIPQLKEVWDDFVYQYIDELGLDQDTKQIIELKRDIVLMEIDYALDKHGPTKTRIEFKMNELREVIKNILPETKPNYNKIKVILEKWLKFPIDTKKTTVLEYFSYLRLHEEYIKEQEKIINDNNRNKKRPK